MELWASLFLCFPNIALKLLRWATHHNTQLTCFCKKWNCGWKKMTAAGLACCVFCTIYKICFWWNSEQGRHGERNRNMRGGVSRCVCSQRTVVPLSTAAATLSVCGKRWTALYSYVVCPISDRWAKDKWKMKLIKKSLQLRGIYPLILIEYLLRLLRVVENMKNIQT